MEPYNYMINTLVQIEMPYGIGNIHIKTCTKLNDRKDLLGQIFLIFYSYVAQWVHLLNRRV